MLLLLSGLTAATVLFGYARSLVIFNGLVRASQVLHNNMFSAVIRTPVGFFDVNPIGDACLQFKEPPTLPKRKKWKLYF